MASPYALVISQYEHDILNTPVLHESKVEPRMSGNN